MRIDRGWRRRNDRRAAVAIPARTFAWSAFAACRRTRAERTSRRGSRGRRPGAAGIATYPARGADGVHNIEGSAQLLFRPLEPFVVDDRGDHKHPGRVARSSLDALWNWVRRDLLPDDANAMASEVAKAMLDGDQAKTERLTRMFQDRVASAIETH